MFDDLGLDVIHFLTPVFLQTDRPTVFSPYDLRHLTYPEQFTEEVLEQRRELYPKGCRRATIVDTLSAAVKMELLEEYNHVNPAKVYPVPMGPALSAADDPVAATGILEEVPDSFVLFPAALWPHKNHERLVEAIQRIESRHGERVTLVCTGTRSTEGVSERSRLESVPEAPQVTDLGFVDTDDLRVLYRACRLLVYPSLYEGGGLPVLEAWEFDAPVACSDIPVLREKGGDAAAYFDPESVPEMADTIHELWTDATLREQLVERGQQRRDLFTWRRTARAYHALYDKAVGTDLSAAQQQALRYRHGVRRR